MLSSAQDFRGNTLRVSYQIDYKELTFGKELGKGGFGIVYQGTWRQHTDVAIKQLLLDDISVEANEEFDTESQMMARLRSPHIVQFYGYCISPRRCIVMEYMPSGSLYSILRNTQQPLDWSIRIRIAIDIASGVAFLHEEHILHRDIKSLNVLLDKSYGAKLSDFGLSKVKNESRSHSMATKTNRNAVGTLAWMAPELFQRRAVYTQKSDVYSLGITFWELAARKIPFSDAGDPSLISGWVSAGEREDIPKDCPQKLASLITACWEGVPDKRPNAGTIVKYLRSDVNDFNQFSSVPVKPSSSDEQRKSNLSVKLVGLTTGHSSLSAALSTLNDLHVSENSELPLPSIFSKSNLPEQKNPVPVLTQFKQVPKPSFTMAPLANASDLMVFLERVAEGEQEKAEAMLKSNPNLALMPGNIRDLSKRTFTNITGFQYAAWALDFHMWTMMKKYLPHEEARAQAQKFETGDWVSEHGVNAQALLDNLLKAYETTISLYEAKKWDEGDRVWVKQVGGTQRLLPAHVVNEYCHPTRPFYPLPDFKNTAMLPRSRLIEEGDWFTARAVGDSKSLHEALGVQFAVYRSGLDHAFGMIPQPGSTGGRMWLGNDRDSIRALSNTRAIQYEKLTIEFGVRNLKKKVNSSELQAFLKLVVAGEQDQAEVMLQKNSDLALVPGDITDLSKRTFTNITGFQYAVWALDWHMWMMIRKYLSDEELRLQAPGLQTGTWVKEYGINAKYLIDNLVKAYEEAISGLEKKEQGEKVSRSWMRQVEDKEKDEVSRSWVKKIGEAQCLLPVHAINEYCHPKEFLYPVRNFRECFVETLRLTSASQHSMSTRDTKPVERGRQIVIIKVKEKDYFEIFCRSREHTSESSIRFKCSEELAKELRRLESSSRQTFSEEKPTVLARNNYTNSIYELVYKEVRLKNGYIPLDFPRNRRVREGDWFTVLHHGVFFPHERRSYNKSYDYRGCSIGPATVVIENFAIYQEGKVHFVELDQHSVHDERQDSTQNQRKPKHVYTVKYCPIEGHAEVQKVELNRGVAIHWSEKELEYAIAIQDLASSELKTLVNHRDFFKALCNTRIAQREKLTIELGIRNVQKKVTTSDLQAFLRFVAEGEQDKAQAMLNDNPALALGRGEVIDLSKRTFTNITGFQYAVWALDWHMWTMIRDYLSDEDIKQQAQGLEIGVWVRDHGIDAGKILKNLCNAYKKVQDAFSSSYDYGRATSRLEEANPGFITEIATAQSLLPAHVVNEFCHKNNQPSFHLTAVLPRTRLINGGEDWFSTLSRHNGENKNVAICSEKIESNDKDKSIVDGKKFYQCVVTSSIFVNRSTSYYNVQYEMDSRLMSDYYRLESLYSKHMAQIKELKEELSIKPRGARRFGDY